MIDYFRDMSDNPFLIRGLAAGVLASAACGMVGPYVITRRIVFLTGAIAHTAVGGIGAAIFIKWHWPEMFGWLSPLHGAFIASVAAAVLIGVVHDRVAERMDTLIGAIWAVGMSAGIVLIKFTPGYHAELMSYLFGSITYVSLGELWLMAGLTMSILITVLCFHKRLLAICLDEEQARLQGINILLTNMVLLVLTALTVICMTQVVGLILVMALLTLPAATASHHVSRLAPMMVISAVLCLVITTAPRLGVYGTRMSPGSAIVLAAGAVYLLSIIARRVIVRSG